MIVLLLLVPMFIIAFMRVNMPFGAKVEGKLLGQITLGLRERMLLQRTNLYLIGGMILILVVAGVLGGPLELIAFVAVLGLLLVPAKYTITSEGIGLNTVVFRSWTDFSGYREERGSIVLEGAEGQRNFRLHVTGANRGAAMKALSRLLAPSGVKRGDGGARIRGGSTAKA